MKQYLYLFPIALLLLSSCIGTDFIDEPLGPVPTRIELSNSSLVLLEGETQQLSAEVIASDESTLDIPVAWSSRDGAIASVSDDGLVEAVAEGQVWVDVTTQTLADSVLVTVSADLEALASIEISGSQSDLFVGDSLQLSVVMRNANGDVLTGKDVTWESTSPTVASIDENGLVSAIDTATTEITATAEGLKSLPYSLMVEEMGADTMVRMGSFTGVNGYSVQGTGTLISTADSAVLRFESDFQTQNGPGLYVYLSPNANNVNGGINLGELKATAGEQSYTLPASANPEDFDYIIIFCQPFRVPFGNANLQ